MLLQNVTEEWQPFGTVGPFSIQEEPGDDQFMIVRCQVPDLHNIPGSRILRFDPPYLLFTKENYTQSASLSIQRHVSYPSSHVHIPPSTQCKVLAVGPDELESISAVSQPDDWKVVSHLGPLPSAEQEPPAPGTLFVWECTSPDETLLRIEPTHVVVSAYNYSQNALQFMGIFVPASQLSESQPSPILPDPICTFAIVTDPLYVAPPTFFSQTTIPGRSNSSDSTTYTGWWMIVLGIVVVVYNYIGKERLLAMIQESTVVVVEWGKRSKDRNIDEDEEEDWESEEEVDPKVKRRKHHQTQQNRYKKTKPRGASKCCSGSAQSSSTLEKKVSKAEIAPEKVNNRATRNEEKTLGGDGSSQSTDTNRSKDTNKDSTASCVTNKGTKNESMTTAPRSKCCSDGNKAIPKKGNDVASEVDQLLSECSNPKPLASPDTHRFELVIEGMTCSGCANVVQKALQSLDDVRSVVVNWKNASAVLLTAQPRLNLVAVARAVDTAGFELYLRANAMPAPANDTNHSSIMSTPITCGSVTCPRAPEAVQDGNDTSPEHGVAPPPGFDPTLQESSLSLIDKLRTEFTTVRRYACHCGGAECICREKPLNTSDEGKELSLSELCRRIEDNLGCGKNSPLYHDLFGGLSLSSSSATTTSSTRLPSLAALSQNNNATHSTFSEPMIRTSETLLSNPPPLQVPTSVNSTNRTTNPFGSLSLEDVIRSSDGGSAELRERLASIPIPCGCHGVHDHNDAASEESTTTPKQETG